MYEECKFDEWRVRLSARLVTKWLQTRLEDDTKIYYTSNRWVLKAEVRLNKTNKRTFSIHHRVYRCDKYMWYYEKYEIYNDNTYKLVRQGVYPIKVPTVKRDTSVNINK